MSTIKPSSTPNSNIGDRYQVGHQQYQLGRLEVYLNGFIESGKIPAIQYLVCDEEKTVFEYHGGWQDVKNRVPVTGSTVFNIASSSKVITAAAILQLVEKNEIDLDLTLCKYFPDHPYGKMSPSDTS